ncbi:hypothetical protein GF415_01065, partial [Candidatus Micrarchaeota archaeon]|nr:hypothetical protein [Candidatus Micrarchaeota archaeon]
MRRIYFVFLGMMLLFAFGCPSEEAPAEPLGEEAGAPEENASVEEIIEGEPVEETTGGETETDGEEPVEEIPEEEEVEANGTEAEEDAESGEEPVACIPVAVSGYAELTVYQTDIQYYGEEGKVVYAEELEMGESLNLPGGSTITLEDIVIDSDCEECGERPSWTYSQKAKLRISVPNAPEDIIVVAGTDEHGFFNSTYECHTWDWDRENCIRYVPDKQKQYYVGKISAEK